MAKKTKENAKNKPIVGKKRKCAELLANPHETRNQGQIASELGVAESTIWRWKQEPEFLQLLSELVSTYTDAELPYAYKCLLSRMPVDTSAIKLFFELKQKYASSDNEVVIRIEGGEDLAD